MYNINPMAGSPDLPRPISFPRPDGSTMLTPLDEVRVEIAETIQITRDFMTGSLPGSSRAQAFSDLVSMLKLEMDADEQNPGRLSTDNSPEEELLLANIDQRSKQDPEYASTLDELFGILNEKSPLIGYDQRLQIESFEALRDEMFPNTPQVE